MKKLIAVLFLLTMIAGAVTPLDLLTNRDAPVSTIDLRNVSPVSAQAIDVLNADLTKWEFQPMDDLGRYYAGIRYEVQYNDTMSSDLQNWLNQYVPIPPSVQSI